MIRLVIAELVAGLRTWLGLLLISTLSGITVGLAASAAETGGAAADGVGQPGRVGLGAGADHQAGGNCPPNG